MGGAILICIFYTICVHLGIKSDFRCKVFKYANSCSEKYSRKPPTPPQHRPEPQKYMYMYSNI